MKNFDPSVAIFANKNITINGKDYSPGDAIDWYEIGLPERRVRQLFEQRKVTHLPQFIQREIKTGSTVEVRKPQKKVADDIVGDFRLSERSKFWFDVLDKDGNKINDKALRKNDAILFAERETEKKRLALEEMLRSGKDGEL